MPYLFMNLPMLLLDTWSAEGTNMNRSVNNPTFDETLNNCNYTATVTSIRDL
jgi:hypothetical protein